jgi:hypothetical protein
LKPLQEQRCLDSGKHHVQIAGMPSEPVPVAPSIRDNRMQPAHEPIAQRADTRNLMFALGCEDAARLAKSHAQWRW